MKMHHIRLLAYVIVSAAAFIGLYLIQQKQYDNVKAAQIAACRRTNIIRADIQNVGQAAKRFAIEAAKARSASGDAGVAVQYIRIANSIHQIRQVDCIQSVKEGRTVYRINK